MPWNGSGTFNRIMSWIADASAGIDITASRFDTDTNDITSNGFANCLTRDGQGSATGNLPMNGFRHTGVGNGVARSDYVSMGQVQDAVALNWSVAGGSADALTVAYTPALTLLVDGQLCFVRGSATANITTAPTLQVNGGAIHPITKDGGLPLAVGDLAGVGVEYILRYNLANTRWDMLNPTQPNPYAIVPLGGMIPYTGSVAPNANFVLPFGQAISRTTYAAYFALVGTAFGVGDGSTTFNVPDMRGRSIFGQDNMGGSAANRITVGGGNFDGTMLGGTGGSQNHTLTTAEMPVHGHSVTDNGHSHTSNSGAAFWSSSGSPISSFATSVGVSVQTQPTTSANVTGVTINNAGSGNAHPQMPPAAILTFILRVL
jgi:microcystin-dependent protein